MTGVRAALRSRATWILLAALCATLSAGPVAVQAAWAGAAPPQLQVSFSSHGELHDQQTVSVTVGPNDYFSPYAEINIVECADPGGLASNLPIDSTTCDGNTAQGPSILVNKDGSFSESDYPVFAVPDLTIGDSADSTPICNQTHYCVLYVGQNTNDFSLPKVFSVPFLVTAGAGAPAATQAAGATSGSGTTAAAAPSSSTTTSTVSAASTSASVSLDGAQGSLADTGAAGISGSRRLLLHSSLPENWVDGLPCVGPNDQAGAGTRDVDCRVRRCPDQPEQKAGRRRPGVQRHPGRGEVHWCTCCWCCGRLPLQIRILSLPAGRAGSLHRSDVVSRLPSFRHAVAPRGVDCDRPRRGTHRHSDSLAPR